MSHHITKLNKYVFVNTRNYIGYQSGHTVSDRWNYRGFDIDMV
jgi:hypothetical protein